MIDQLEQIHVSYGEGVRIIYLFILFFNTTGGRQRVADEVKTAERTAVKRIVPPENQS